MNNYISFFSLIILLFAGCREQIAQDQSTGSADTIARTTVHYTGNVDFRYAARITTPCVVNVKSTYQQSTQEEGDGFYRGQPDPFKEFFKDNPFFRHFDFETPEQRPWETIPRQATGSGVIVRSDGYLITNNHVVNDAEEVEITLFDRRTYQAKLVGFDAQTDIALLKIDEQNLSFLEFGDSDSLEVGEWVVAVGNPFNLASTVTAGIVSAKGRNINIMRDQGAIESFIQTDAAVNPGNSGGALVNLKGKLIGINTAIATPTGVYAGYAFAIPSDIVKKVTDDLLKYGEVRRGILGVTIRNLDSKLAEELNIKQTTGVYIDSVIPESAAKDAGLKRGDVVVKIEDQEMSSAPQLQEFIARRQPGDKIDITVIRDGKVRNISAILKSASKPPVTDSGEGAEVLNLLGVELQELTNADLAHYQVNGGVKIKKLLPGKLKNETDIQEGFVITSVNKVAIDSINAFIEEIQSQKGGIMLEGKYFGDSKVYYYAFGL